MKDKKLPVHRVEISSLSDAKNAVAQGWNLAEDGVSSVTDLAPTKEYEQCDFCSSRQPTWEYPCRDFITMAFVTNHATHTQGSKGEWLACDTCHELIERNARGELVDRQIEMLGMPGDDDRRPFVRGLLIAQLGMFFAYRSGPAKHL